MIEREGRWAIDTDEDCRFVEPPTLILTDRDLEDLEKLIKRVRAIRDARG